MAIVPDMTGDDRSEILLAGTYQSQSSWLFIVKGRETWPAEVQLETVIDGKQGAWFQADIPLHPPADGPATSTATAGAMSTSEGRDRPLEGRS